mgnify:CR=1 FL=1
MDQVLASGWFLKMGKTLNRYMIDPFSLVKVETGLVAVRSAKRLLVLKQDSYSLVNLQVSPSRALSNFEYSFLATSEIRDQIQGTLSLQGSRCFDIVFGVFPNEKSMTVFASYVYVCRHL